MLLLFTVLGCGNDEPAACRAGFTLGDDGLCYEDAAGDDTDVDTDGGDTGTPPPTLDDVLAALPACEAGYADGRLDLDHGCADGVCAGDRYADMVAVLGDPVDCSAIDINFDGYEDHQLDCSWSDGLSVYFDDADQDGVPDDSAPFSLDVAPPFDGGTADGLSLNASMSCFYEALGEPLYASFDRGDDGVWYAVSLGWDTVYVDDWSGKGGTYGHDGYADSITLYAH